MSQSSDDASSSLSASSPSNTTVDGEVDADESADRLDWEFIEETNESVSHTPSLLQRIRSWSIMPSDQQTQGDPASNTGQGGRVREFVSSLLRGRPGLIGPLQCLVVYEDGDRKRILLPEMHPKSLIDSIPTSGHVITSLSLVAPENSAPLNKVPLVLALPTLRQLTLEGHDLSKTPPSELRAFTALHSLCLQNNSIREFPPSLPSVLTELAHLELQNNMLTTFCPHLKSLESWGHRLEFLSLSHNQISSLPGTLGHLTALRQLMLSHNKLSSLPAELASCSNLLLLDLSNNALVTPSVGSKTVNALIRDVIGSIEGIGGLRLLRDLNLSRNKITDLPISFTNLANLTSLDISHNRLTRWNLPGFGLKLITLNLRGNQLGPTLSDQISALTQLQRLDVGHNKLHSIGVTLASMNMLNHLNLSHNKLRSLDDLPKWIRSLQVHHNKLRDCRFIDGLAGLSTLNLSYNSIKQLPRKELLTLIGLRDLNLSHNLLIQLPDGFDSMSTLSVLDLSSNALKTLPGSWSSVTFPSLVELNLAGNPNAAVTLPASFASIGTLQKVCLLGATVHNALLSISRSGSFDVEVLIKLARRVPHPLFILAMCRLACQPEYMELVMRLACDVLVGPLRSEEYHIADEWPPKHLQSPEAQRYHALQAMIYCSETAMHDSRVRIFDSGITPLLMRILMKHADDRIRFLAIKLLGCLALDTGVKRQMCSDHPDVIPYLESLANNGSELSISRACSVFGVFARHPRRGIRILTLDGGGTRSIAQVAVLQKIRDLGGLELRNCFDLVVGTSAGALIALSFLRKKTMEENMEMYMERGHLCFALKEDAHLTDRTSEPAPNRATSWRSILNLAQKGAIYKSISYEYALKEFYGEDSMITFSEDSTCPKVVVATTITSVVPAVPFLIRNYDPHPSRPSRYDGTCMLDIWEAARATSAAPTFFDPFEKDGLVLMDGGITCNNPTALALHEAKCIWGEQVHIDMIVSLGTGLRPSKPSDKGVIDAVTRLVDAAVSSSRIHEVMLDVLPPHVQYERINPIGEVFKQRLDEIQKSALVKLHQYTLDWMEEEPQKSQIQGIVDRLKEEKTD